jgi:hypothetical protein
MKATFHATLGVSNPIPLGYQIRYPCVRVRVRVAKKSATLGVSNPLPYFLIYPERIYIKKLRRDAPLFR